LLLFIEIFVTILQNFKQHTSLETKIIGVTWKDIIGNEEVKTGMDKWANKMRKTAVRHLEEDRIPKQVLYWEMKKKRGWLRLDWIDSMYKNLEDIKMTREEAEEAVRHEDLEKLCGPMCCMLR